MIMDEKGRLFGKISVIDICALLVVVALFAGAYYKFFMVDPQHTAGRFDTIEYTVLLKEKATVEGLEIGAEIYDVRTGSYMGKIQDMAVMPSTALVTKTDGTMVLAEKPERFDVLLTITVPGVETAYGFLANGKKEINRETTEVLKTLKAMMEGKIADVRNLSKM